MAAQNQEPSSGLPSSGSGRQLATLPAELLLVIISHLPNGTIKNLRLTSRFFHVMAKLRLSRIFLSRNPLDIEVFRAIADHETFRKDVVELIWDDSVFAIPRFWELDYQEETYHERKDGSSYVPALWRKFREVYQDCLKSEWVWKSGGNIDPLPAHVCWGLFDRLMDDQHESMSRGTAGSALSYGLQRFPSLRTIRITPHAHGYFNQPPLYETPTIRSFPLGFVYPKPYDWPEINLGTEVPDWRSEFSDYYTYEEYCNDRDFNPSVFNYAVQVPVEYCGIVTILRELRRHGDNHAVTELVVEPNVESSEIELNSILFGNLMPYVEYHDDLVSLLRRPGFRRLSLALVGVEHWTTDLTAGFERALKHIGPDLESLTTAVEDRDYGSYPNMTIFRDVFPCPSDKWPRLHHFGLIGFTTTRAEVLALVKVLPKSLRTLELGLLGFWDDKEDERGGWRGLLEDLRDRLGWRTRWPAERVKVNVRVDMVDAWTRGLPHTGMEIWLDKEADAFLYGDGENPFRKIDWSSEKVKLPLKEVKMGMGFIRNRFDPTFESPNVTKADLVRLGYVRKPRSSVTG